MNKMIFLFGLRNSIQAAKELGIYTINILIDGMIEPGNTFFKASQLSDETIVVNSVSDIEEAIMKRTQEENISGIISFTDSMRGVFLAAQYSEKYLEKNNFASEKAVLIVENKFLTRKLLDEISLDNIPYILPKNKKDIINFISSFGAAILKPVDLQGSENIVRITDCENLDDITYAFNDKFILEKFINGKEYSVESIVLNGKTHVLGITEKEIIGNNQYGHNPFVEAGHIVPAQLSADVMHSITQYITRFFDNLDVYNALTHSEIFVTPEKKIILVETHIRAGGDNIPELVKFSTGIDMFKANYKGILGEEVDLTIKKTKKVAIGYLILPTGEVKSIKDGSPYSKGLLKNRILIEVGDTITPIKDSFDRKWGYVIMEDDNCPQNAIINYFRSMQIELE